VLSALLKACSSPGQAPAGAAAALAVASTTAFDNTVDAASWADGTKQHGVLAFSSEQMAFERSTTGHWLVVVVALTDGKVLTLAAGAVDVMEDGYSSGGSAPVVEGLAYTKAEALALFGSTRNDITARTGGGATALDGIVTAGGAVATGTSVRTLSGASGAREEWLLIAGTTAEAASAGIVRPDDYHGSTNVRIWKQVL